MKKWRYSAGMKAAVLVAHQCLVTVLALCLMVLVLLFAKNILNFDEKSDIAYADTDYFADQFKSAAMEILEFIDLRRKFETDGVYDADKEVDVWQYYENQEIPENTEKRKKKNTLIYRLGDLADWSRGYFLEPMEFVSECYLDNGIKQRLEIYRAGESVYSEEKEIHCLEDFEPGLKEKIIQEVEHYYGGSYSVSAAVDGWAVVSNTQAQDAAVSSSKITDEAKEAAGSSKVSDEAEEAAASSEASEGLPDEGVTVGQEAEGSDIIDKVVEGKLFELSENELAWLLSDMDMSFSSSEVACNYVDEAYLPIEGVGIWEMFLQGECSLEYLQNASRAIEFTLDNISEEISRYRKGVNHYYKHETGTSNIYYWVVQNKDGNVYTNIEDSEGLELPSFGRKLGKFIIYRESDARLETNVKDMDEFFYNRIEPLFIKKGSVVYIGVNTLFPYKDAFQEARAEYNRMHHWIRICLWGAVGSFLLELICLIYLSIVAGKRDDSGKVYLNVFDMIPTELLILPAAVEIIFFVFGLGSVWAGYAGGDYISLLLLSCIIVFLGTAFLLVFYLSFIRRIRAGVLWRHSILRWFVHGIGQLFKRRKSSTKMLIWFGLHLLACLFILPIVSIPYDGGVLSFGVAMFAVLCGVEAVLIIREGVQRNKIMEGIGKIASGDLEYKIDESELKGDNKKLAQAVNTIGEGLHNAVDESMKNERLQADLITNVSHDIKTPLTSIINYVDLLKREDLQNERAQNYIKVLDVKSQRLKQLAEDLVEASRISSGNINLDMVRINLVELVHQTEGEFAERFEERGLKVISNLPKESVVILADGRRIWRVLENLYQNVTKYAMEQTRVYVDLQADGEKVSFSIKNISENPLNIEAEELTERFIRGDVSRSTEGSGLGLSIAQNLTTLMGGTFEIYLDGDLFKVMIEFEQQK